MFGLKKIIVVFLLLSFGANAQINLDFLFSPGVTIGTEFQTSSGFADSSDFNFSKHEIGFSVPLKTKINVGLKKLSLDGIKLSSSQLFLTSKIGLNNSLIGAETEQVYKFDLGLSGIYAGLNKGVWLYGINGYLNDNDDSFESPYPNFRAYVTRAKIKNLDFVYLYGAAVVFHNGRFIPSPVLGLYKKWGDVRLKIILPRELRLTYKVDKGFKLNVGSSLDGLNTVYREGNSFSSNDYSLNYRRVKLFFGVEKKVKNFKLSVLGGVNAFNQIDGYHSDYSEKVDNSYFVSFSLNYQFGKSLFGQVFSF